LDLNSEVSRVRKKQSSAIIAVDVRRFGHVINKNEVFGQQDGLGPDDDYGAKDARAATIEPNE
jgi:hypothetical protein